MTSAKSEWALIALIFTAVIASTASAAASAATFTLAERWVPMPAGGLHLVHQGKRDG